MITRCEACNRVYDDEFADTGCPHYPLGTGAATFCRRCDLYRPCVCDKAPDATVTADDEWAANNPPTAGFIREPE